MEPGVSISTPALCVGAVNLTILVEVWVNSVSMPPALLEAAGAGGGLLATLTGRVKERRTLALDGAREPAGDDMAGRLRRHCWQAEGGCCGLCGFEVARHGFAIHAVDSAKPMVPDLHMHR